MKKINYNYDEVVYTTKLKNGIDVYMYPTTKSKNFYITVSTHFGAEVMKYKKGNKTYEVTKGSAHFLEHRVMDFTKNKDAMEKINELGSLVNAYTTYNGTNYNIYGQENIKENLKLLFDRVFKANIKEEDVEMERGIILEEYSMYNSNPYYKAQTSLCSNLFNESFLKYSVIGTEEGIKNVPCKELQRLYKDFYTPNNMFIVVVGNFNKEEVLEYIEEYMKEVPARKEKIKVIKPKEKYEVACSYEEITEVLNEQKVVIGYKIKNPSVKDRLTNKIILDMIINENFGKTGKSYLRLMEKGLSRFDYSVEEVDDYFLVLITSSTDKIDEFIKIIDEEMNTLEFTDEILSRKVKGFISSLILTFEDIINVEDTITSDLFAYNRPLNDLEQKIKEIKLKDAKELLKSIDIKNKSVLVMKK